MLQVSLDIVTGVAKLGTNSALVFKANGHIPVTLTLSDTPASISGIALSLGSDTIPPAVLAYCGTFTGSGITYTGSLVANDTRLLAYLATRKSAPILVELAMILNGVTFDTESFKITVQPPVNPGPDTSVMGGPVYITTAYIDDTDTLSTNDALHVPSTRATIAYVAAHGGGGGGGGSLPYVQRQYLNTGETLTVPAECALICAGTFRNDGTLTLDGDIYFV